MKRTCIKCVPFPLCFFVFKGCGQQRLGKRSTPVRNQFRKRGIVFNWTGSGGTRPTTAALTALYYLRTYVQWMPFLLFSYRCR